MRTHYVAAIAALGLFSALPASAQISGFGSGFTFNHGGDALHTGDGGDGGNGASVTSNVLTITDKNNSESNSVFYNTKQNITNWNASFTYTVDTAYDANGVCLVFQNAPSGVNALGGRGDGQGWGSNDSGGRAGATIPNYIANSAALITNIYQNDGVGISYQTAGASGAAITNSFGSFTTPGTVNLISGDPIQYNLSYNGTTLSETLTDTITNASFNTTYATSLATVVGGNTAYVGFTGGTGGYNALQTISNFTFTPAPEPSQYAGLGLGVLGLAGLALRARRQQKA
jgi:hypothetical protein